MKMIQGVSTKKIFKKFQFPPISEGRWWQKRHSFFGRVQEINFSSGEIHILSSETQEFFQGRGNRYSD